MTQPALFRDRAPAAPTSATSEPCVPCPACGHLAPRVMVGVGLDVHECERCRALCERWACCGAVVPVPASPWGWRERDVCAVCGRDRRPAAVPAPPLEPGEFVNHYGVALAAGGHK